MSGGQDDRRATLVNRLRGIYTVPVNDGGGLLDGKDTFTNTFPVPPIQKEAAEEIERLEGLIRWRDDHGFFLAYDNSDPPQLWVWRGEPEDETAEPWQRVLSSEEVDE
jgi:hypothetical protein